MIRWRMTDGIEFKFPRTLTLPAGGCVVLVNDAATFAALYPDVPAGVPVLEWDSGNLNNAGEKVELSMAGDQEWEEDRYWIRLDRVNYENGWPWPTAADGQGQSLTRIDPTAYGNDPANWTAADPSPGW